MQQDFQEKFTFTWEIENFKISILRKIWLHSPKFVPDISKTINWCLQIGITDQGDLFCFLIRTKDGANEITITYTIELRTDSGEILQSRTSKDTFSKEFVRKGWSEFYKIYQPNSKLFYAKSVTFQCLMFVPEPAKDYSGCKGKTKISVDHWYFKWNIKEINSPSWKASKIFLYSSEADFEATLTAPEDFVNISIKKLPKENSSLHYVDCKLSLLDLNEVEKHSTRSQYLYKFSHNTEIWNFPDFLQKSKLHEEKKNYHKNGTFTLICEFSISNGKSVGYIEEYYNDNLGNSRFDSDICSSVVLQDLKHLYTRKFYTDVNLRTRKQTFQAHKFILSARSPVFAAMFKQDNQTKVVDIPDVEDKILDCFLMYLYAGTVDNLDYESMLKLIIIADRYQVPFMKKQCTSFLISNLSISNVCDAAMIADMNGNEELKKYTVEFIVAHSDKILASDDWWRCIQSNSNLVTDVLYKLSINFGAVSKTKLEVVF